MLPEDTYAWGKKRSCIRDLAEYGRGRKKEIGDENVYDFSLGNPSIQEPKSINKTIIKLATLDSDKLHHYTTAAGLVELRENIASSVNKRFNTNVTPGLIYVTCGAASSMTITLKAILTQGDEVLVSAPFFPEYRVFTQGQGGKLRVVKPKENLDIDLDEVKKAINKHTRAMIVNSPNNPSGVVYSEETLMGLTAILKEASKQYEREIYLITDEPYRELVFDGITCHSPIEYYDNTIMCYSWSKALSIPGERIGYIAVSDRLKDKEEVYYSIMGAGRCLGYVNPPSLFQRVICECLNDVVDVSIYEENRNVLMEGLSKIGYEFIKPEGAFYLMLKCLENDAKSFSEQAKKHELLLVPSDDFGVEGYVRISFCVPKRKIENSLNAFEELYKDYKK